MRQRQLRERPDSLLGRTTEGGPQVSPAKSHRACASNSLFSVLQTFVRECQVTGETGNYPGQLFSCAGQENDSNFSPKDTVNWWSGLLPCVEFTDTLISSLSVA